MRKSVSPCCHPRFRIFHKGEIALGPGKVELLRAIQESGSIRKAAAELEMSYMRAWQLVRTMNAAFREPLIASARGGADRGGAKLTGIGLQALALYERLESESLAATKRTRAGIARLLR